MTPEELKAIKERLQYVNGAYAFDIPASTRLVFTDVPALVAEVERLQRIEAAAKAYVAQMDANDKHVADCEAIGSSPSSVGAVRAIKTLAALRAAIDAAEGGE